MMWGYNWGWSGWVAMSLTMVVWALVIIGIVSLVRYVNTRDSNTTQATTSRPPVRSARQRPRELLAARFARGEIDSDEYTQRLRTLRSESGSAGVSR